MRHLFRKAVVGLITALCTFSAGHAAPDDPKEFENRIVEYLRRAPEFEERFGLRRPWDSMANVPALIRRHRGMVAAALAWLDDAPIIENEKWWPSLDRALEMLSALDANEDYFAKQRNEFWSAYYSQVDGSGQFFVTTVPNNIDLKRKYPLMVHLHGRGGRPMPNFEASHKKEDYISVSPWGRGDVGYYALGEDDILQVIAYMKAWYPIDHDRIYLKGLSLGGLGTWVIASRHPDLFAAVAPYFGYTYDLPLENLLNVPLFSQHGTKDWVVPIDHHRWAINRIQKLRYPAYHLEHPGAGHGISNPFDDEGWMLQRTRVKRPTSVTYTCQTPERGKAYWIHIREFTDVHLRAHIQAQVEGNGIHQSLLLSPRNISVLGLDASNMPIDSGQSMHIQVGQDTLRIDAPIPGQFFVVNDGVWQLKYEVSEPSGASRPYRPGAAANLYDGEPLKIVYGTQGEEGQTTLNRRIAEKLAFFPGYRSEMPVGGISVKADEELTEDDLLHFNLILIGGKTENSLVARMEEQLPFRINRQNELVVSDRDPVSLNEAVLRLFYFNPLNPQRSIVLLLVNGGQPTETKLEEINPRMVLGDSQGNYRGDQPDLAVHGIDGTLRRAMQFTTDWEWLDVPGADRLISAQQAAAYATAVAQAHAIHRAVHDADFVLARIPWKRKPDDLLYDSRWFSYADMAIVRNSRQTAIVTLTGRELTEFHDRWIQEREMVADPSIDMEALEADRLYRIAVKPVMFWIAEKRRRNFTNVQSGPDWDPSVARDHLFQGVF